MGGRFVERAVRFLFKAYFRLVHRVTIVGLEHIPPKEGRLILVANHGSLLDGPLLWAFLPLRFKTLVAKDIAELPLLRTVLTSEYIVKVSTLQSYSLKHVIAVVEQGIPLLIFPEGRRSTTGSLMKIYEGGGFIAQKTQAAILPVHIRGNYNVPTSRAPGKKKLFGRLTIVIGPPRPPLSLDRLSPRERRREAASILYMLLSETRYAAQNRQTTVAAELIRLCRENRRRTAFKDATQRSISYGRMLAGAFLLGEKLSSCAGRNIGILLPNLGVTVLVYFGLLLCRKVPAFLNYASGERSLRHMMALVDLQVIVTSREFLERIGLSDTVLAGKTLVFLEDVERTVRLKEKLSAAVKSRFPGRYYRAASGEEKGNAVILFTSGSEGKPKGVPLTNKNIIANIHQCLSRIDVTGRDYLLNALPLFHSFGLTVGALLPLFAGARVFLYVSPLHYRVVPETSYRENCTILIGTNIFLHGYARRSNPYDFYSVRYIYCGAEALSGKVFDTYAKKFGIRVLTGYGATECAPVVSLNNAIEYEYGSVGKLLPGMAHRIVPVEGLESRDRRIGRLYVKGENVMAGYLKNEAANRKYRVEDGGWYDTGDIVEEDERGFLTIVGRQKRFAKVSGEMISLTAIEEALAGGFGGRREAAVIATPDVQHGEKIVLIANDRRISLRESHALLSAEGFSEIAQPRSIRYVEVLPKLATGKVDYVKLKEVLAGEEKEIVPV